MGYDAGAVSLLPELSVPASPVSAAEFESPGITGTGEEEVPPDPSPLLSHPASARGSASIKINTNAKSFFFISGSLSGG